MTVKDMHIEINQSTQLVAANRSRKWYPEEIDWVLNKIMGRFIEGCLVPRSNGSGGFQVDQVRADDIRAVIVSGKRLKTYIETENTYIAYLPPDYNYLISDASFTFPTNCGEPPQEKEQVLYLQTIEQKQTAKVSSQFYESVELIMQGVHIQVPEDLPYNYDLYNGYTDKQDIIFLTPYLLWKANKWELGQVSKPGLYWEKFGKLYIPNTFINVLETSPITLASLEFDGISETIPDTQTVTLKYHDADNHKFHSNRLTPSNLIASMRGSAFYKTSYISPISELESNLLRIYSDKSITVCGAEISYIRKPQPISLHLGTDCELSETVHQKICDLTTEYMQSRVKDTQGVTLTEQDMAKRILL